MLYFKSLLLIVISSFFIINASNHTKTNNGLTFDTLEYDMGNLIEGEIGTYRFEFINTGYSTVNIKNVRASCGCTTPKWTTEPIEPNEEGFIDVSYDSNRRPGKFNKKIYVETDAAPAPIVLTITGFVKPKKLEGKDLVEQGGLAISEGTIAFQNWDKTKLFRHAIKVQNISDQPIKIASVVSPERLEVVYPPYTFFPGEIVSVGIKLNLSFETSTTYKEKIILKTNDKNQPEKTIQVMGTVLQPVDQSSNRAYPEVQFKNEFIDLGELVQGESKTVAFEFTNTGNAPLRFTSIRPSCGCTVAELDKSEYLPGESGILSATLDTEGKIGIIRKEITIETNDPSKEEFQLVLETNIKEHPNLTPEMMRKMSEHTSIFEGSCRSCHVDRGVNKFGSELFVADCQMCHGPIGGDDKHHPGQQFTQEYINKSTTSELLTWIREGSPNPAMKNMMPGFHTQFGGPLTDEQVASLVGYIKSFTN